MDYGLYGSLSIMEYMLMNSSHLPLFIIDDGDVPSSRGFVELFFTWHMDLRFHWLVVDSLFLGCQHLCTY